MQRRLSALPRRWLIRPKGPEILPQATLDASSVQKSRCSAPPSSALPRYGDVASQRPDWVIKPNLRLARIGGCSRGTSTRLQRLSAGGACDEPAAGRQGSKSATTGGRVGSRRRSRRRDASRRAEPAFPFRAHRQAGFPRHRPPAMKRIFCLVPVPTKTPSGRSLYRTRRNGRSPSLNVHIAAAWNEGQVVVPASPR